LNTILEMNTPCNSEYDRENFFNGSLWYLLIC